MSKRSSRKKKERKRIVKSKMVPIEKVRKFLHIIEKLETIYLDNAILGYKTDSEREKKCAKNLLWFVRKHNRKTFISFITVYEIRPIFQGKKFNSRLKKQIIAASKEFSPEVISEKETIRLLRKNKDFFDFLLKLGVKEGDAAHFTVTAFSGIDLFVSFNKRIFRNRKTKINNELMRRRIKPPETWSIDELEPIMKEIREYNF